MARKGFVVYGLQRPSGRIFYVGRSVAAAVTGRLTEHLKQARREGRTAKSRAIRAIWATGGQVRITVLSEVRDTGEADAEEVRLIAHYGLRNLVNVHPGGSCGPYTGIDGGPVRTCRRGYGAHVVIDDIPPELWTRVRAKCKARKTSVRVLLLRQLTHWVEKP